MVEGSSPTRKTMSRHYDADSHQGLLNGIYSIIFQNPSDKKSQGGFSGSSINEDENARFLPEVDAYVTVCEIMKNLAFSSNSCSNAGKRRSIPNNIYEQNILSISLFQFRPDQYREFLSNSH
jgi:hypothetical protein